MLLSKTCIELKMTYLKMAILDKEDDFKRFLFLKRHSTMSLFTLPLPILQGVPDHTTLADPRIEVEGNVSCIALTTLEVDTKPNNSRI